ncbi:hypothetical protein WMY93_031091 [Mugilogobius chulae]|uniref:Uncharacterized protein n=1 Tax=Mugilogobius chulae TaxID=88201 RepID=A0AAW0MDZ1_9GOBI
MELPKPAIEFMSTQGQVCARSTADPRWYKVEDIMRRIALIPRGRPRVRYFDMISMDLYAMVLKNTQQGQDSLLQRFTEYLCNINVPCTLAKVVASQLAEMFRKPNVVTPRACMRLLDRSYLIDIIGNAVKMECSKVFNGEMTGDQVGPVSRAILSQLKALGLIPMGGRLKVAGIPRPDFCRGPPYSYHNGCVQGCESLKGVHGSFTSVDLVARDTSKDQVVLLHIIVNNNFMLDNRALWRYHTQLWLTWLMFSLTYPSVAERSAAYLVMIRPGIDMIVVLSVWGPIFVLHDPANEV